VFYERFLRYDFILIYQLDAFVFKDELAYWCRKENDYIGAPWLVQPFQREAVDAFYARILYTTYFDRGEVCSLSAADIKIANKVGNGGFSLRKVNKFYQICLQEQQMINFYKQNSQHHFFNEDVFWSLETCRREKQIKIPDFIEALGFSIEIQPEYAFTLTGNRLPFGCHAWPLFINFWRGMMNNFGYHI